MTDVDESIEAEVLRMWADAGLRPASAQDDFFDLGGQSIILVRFLANVFDRYGVEAPIDALVEQDLTAAHAAEVIRHAQRAQAQLGGVPAGEG